MTPSLILSSNNAANPLTRDLSQYLDLTEGTDMDVLDPSFSTKVMARSMLKVGATLALEQFVEKQLVFPLALNAPTSSALAILIQQINQIITSPGATFSWQDSGMSQPTIFDGLSGEFDIHYSYRQSSSPAHWCKGDLKLFTQPLGHTTGPRAYAAASGVGPLLMITPYASSGALAIGASTQAGVAGFGGAPAGASSGIFYPGSPSLAGDAPAQLQVAWQGPRPFGAGPWIPPVAAFSLLPDPTYQPLTAIASVSPGNSFTASQPGAINGEFLRTKNSLGVADFDCWFTAAIPPTLACSGNHRLFAIARASTAPGVLSTQAGGAVLSSASSVVYPGDWSLVDLGTFSVNASQTIQPTVYVNVNAGSTGANCPVDLTAFVMLPDSRTWFVNGGVVASNPNYETPSINLATNTYVIDDVIGRQYIGNPSQVTSASSYRGAAGTQADITCVARGLVPTPDPKDGLPIIAVLGVTAIGAASNPQTQPSYAQATVLERTRYVLP